jgi:glycosyltransferase involved in cell wall biosynthesis
VRFSVVIPCYNAAATIERALRSVFAQTCKDFEVLVIDDGSSDYTAEAALRAAPPEAVGSGTLRVITQENLGAATARNRGMAEARGEAVAFLDDDDYWDPEYLETMARVLDLFPAAGAVCSNYIGVDAKGAHPAWRRAAPPASAEPFLVPDYVRARATDALAINTSGVVLRRSTVEAVGGMRDDLRRSQDTEYWARIAAHGILWAFSPRPLSYFDQTDKDSVSRTRSGSWYARIPLPELWSRDIWPLLEPAMVAGFTDLYLMRARYLCALFLEAGVGEMAKAAARDALPRAAGRPAARLHLGFVATMPPRLTWRLWQAAATVRRRFRRSSAHS